MDEGINLEIKSVKNLMTNYSPNIRDHFPFPEIRPSQELGLQAIERAYASDKKFIILELPTGEAVVLQREEIRGYSCTQDCFRVFV